MTFRTPLKIRTNDSAVEIVDREWLVVASAALPVEKADRDYILNGYNAIVVMANRAEALR